MSSSTIEGRKLESYELSFSNGNLNVTVNLVGTAQEILAFLQRLKYAGLLNKSVVDYLIELEHRVHAPVEQG